MLTRALPCEEFCGVQWIVDLGRTLAENLPTFCVDLAFIAR